MTLKSINGYASWTSLVCLFLVLQIVSFLTLSTIQNVYLLKANRQSMIYRNNRIKLCHTKEELIKEKDETIMNIHVHFQDYSTYMECTYDNVCMKIYYDDKSIVDVVIDEP